MKYEDIKKGQRIRTTWKERDVVITLEGVAAHEGAGYWTSSEWEYLAFKEGKYTFELIEHPEPEGLGKIIRYGGDTYVSVHPDPGAIRWCKTPRGKTTRSLFYRWDEFDPELIEIL